MSSSDDVYLDSKKYNVGSSSDDVVLPTGYGRGTTNLDSSSDDAPLPTRTTSTRPAPTTRPSSSDISIGDLLNDTDSDEVSVTMASGTATANPLATHGTTGGRVTGNPLAATVESDSDDLAALGILDDDDEPPPASPAAASHTAAVPSNEASNAGHYNDDSDDLAALGIIDETSEEAHRARDDEKNPSRTAEEPVKNEWASHPESARPAPRVQEQHVAPAPSRPAPAPAPPQHGSDDGVFDEEPAPASGAPVPTSQPVHHSKGVFDTDSISLSDNEEPRHAGSQVTSLPTVPEHREEQPNHSNTHNDTTRMDEEREAALLREILGEEVAPRASIEATANGAPPKSDDRPVYVPRESRKSQTARRSPSSLGKSALISGLGKSALISGLSAADLALLQNIMEDSSDESAEDVLARTTPRRSPRRLDDSRASPERINRTDDAVLRSILKNEPRGSTTRGRSARKMDQTRAPADTEAAIRAILADDDPPHYAEPAWRSGAREEESAPRERQREAPLRSSPPPRSARRKDSAGGMSFASATPSERAFMKEVMDEPSESRAKDREASDLTAITATTNESRQHGRVRRVRAVSRKTVTAAQSAFKGVFIEDSVGAEVPLTLESLAAATGTPIEELSLLRLKDLLPSQQKAGGQGPAPQAVVDARIKAADKQKTKTLSLARKGITALPESVTRLIRLEKLLLQENKLQSLPPTIGRLRSLRILALHGNQLESLPPQMANLALLQELHLGHNKLLNITLPPFLGNLKHLTWLDLSHNSLTMVPTELCGLSALQSLDLSNNELTSIPWRISALTNLRGFYLIKNNLTSLPSAIGGLRSLRTLSLEGNQLSSLPEELLALPALVRLTLDHNPINFESPDVVMILNHVAHNEVAHTHHTVVNAEQTLRQSQHQ